MHVSVGDTIRRGQLLVEDKRIADGRHTAPAAGKIVAIHRGDRRALQSIVIELDRSERGRQCDEAPLRSFSGGIQVV